MSFFGKVWGGIKKVGKTVGSIAEKAAPVLNLIPGVGTVAAGAIGGLGGLMAGDGLSGVLKGATGGLLGGVAKGLLSKIPGADSLGGSIANYAKKALLGGGTNPNGFDLGDLGSIAKLAGTGLGAVAGYQGYKQSQADSKQARSLTEEQAQMARDQAARAVAQYNSLAPLRAAFIQGAQSFAGNPMNPFSQLYNNAAPAAAPASVAPTGTIAAAAQPVQPVASPGIVGAMATPSSQSPSQRLTM